MAKKVYVGAPNFEKVTLPDGYTQVAHIGGTGTQYFDTGVTATEDIKIETKIVKNSTATNQMLFGASWGYTDFSAAFYDGNFRFHAKGKYFDVPANSLPNEFEVVATQTYCIVNGVMYSLNGTQAIKANSIYIFNVPEGTPPGLGLSPIKYFRIYTGNKLVRNLIPCKNASGTAGLCDLANSAFRTNAGTGTFVVGSTYKENTARKVKQMYIGVSDKARRVRKGYIGVGGVARPFWGEGKLEYYGTITGLSVGRYELSATTVGNYALFAGGFASGQYHTTVDAYNTSLTRSTPTALSSKRVFIAATAVGDYALFGGGSGDGMHSTVDAYNKSLTRSTPTALSDPRGYLAATTVGDYALFGGGTSSSYRATVDAYNKSLTRSTPTALSVGRGYLAATAVGDYALFGGGIASNVQSTVDAYNKSLTRSTPTGLSVARNWIAATTVGDYALFGGGATNGMNGQNAVDAYNKSLTRSTPTKLSVARAAIHATTVGDYALFGGGAVSSTPYTTVDAYNKSLTRSTPTELNVGRLNPAATSVGNYALFGGGCAGSTYYATVDAYVVK